MSVIGSALARAIEPKRPLEQERQRFSNGALRAMIVPLLIEQLLQMIVGLVDTMMVSYAGEATVSGVSLDTLVYSIFIALFTATATGGAVVVSQYIGSGARDQADRAVSQVFRLAGIVSVICMVIVLAGGSAILSLLYPAVDGEVMAACRTYLTIVTLSFPANAVYNAGAAMYRSLGQTRTTMKVSLSMNLLNVAGNAVGIFALRAGAAGVAWPTVIAWYFAAFVMTRLCLKKNGAATLRPKYVIARQPEMARRILRIAAPNAVENAMFQLVKVVLGSIVSTFGTAQIAANGIGQTLWSLSTTMCISMGPVFITVVGRCMGAGDPDAADWYVHKLMRLTLILAFLWNLLMLALMPLILPLYSVSAETRHYIWIIVLIHNAFAAFVQPFARALPAGLRAAGDAKFTMWSLMISTVACRTALSFALGLWMGLGVVGITIAMGLDWCIKGALDTWRYRTGVWRTLKVI